MTAATPRPRRGGFTAALAATAAGAAALAAASGRTWATGVVEVAGPTAPAPVELAGTDLAPAASAMGIAGLAALAALVAARGWPRRIIGLLMTLFGAIALQAVWSGTRPAELARVAAEQATTDGRVAAPDLAAAWPALAAAGAALLVLSGLATAVRGPSWPGMGSRYDRHSVPRTARTGDPAELWKSLDSGEDPTLDPAAPDTAAPPADARCPSTAPRTTTTTTVPETGDNPRQKEP
ncbi:Trp biosynthesis-associated membrane protein [Nocardiopsis mangrovi]|uniref:Trp biosynthesis-associated membrane protein n=1 Tax=Nocardiopsis mangrovi TaxID=1179818 RepID=A0ABV9DSJ5_9ACTN